MRRRRPLQVTGSVGSLAAGGASPIEVRSREVQQVFPSEVCAAAMKPLPALVAPYGAAACASATYAARIGGGTAREALTDCLESALAVSVLVAGASQPTQ